MWIKKIKAFLSRAKATLPGRWFWLLIGLGSITYSQSLIQQRNPVGEVNQALEIWNIAFRLEIVNMQNLGAAILPLIAGGIICALAFLPGWQSREDFQDTSKEHTKLNWPYLLPRLSAAILLFAYLLFKLGRHEYNPSLPWVWILTLALIIYLFYRRENANKTNLSLEITRTDILWLLSLFLAGLAIGAFALQDIPNILVPDEGSFWETGRAIAAGEFKPAFFDFGVYTFPVASSIFQGWIMRLFGINLWGWRFASILAGAVTVFPLYLFAREWFDRRVAVMAALFMVSSPYYLSFARLGYNNSQALFPVVLSFYFWSLGYKQNSHLYFWLAGVAAGLGFYTYPAAWLGLVTIIAVTVILTILRRINFRQVFVTTAILLAAAFVTAGPRLIYGASSENSEPLFFKLAETSFVSAFYGSAYYGSAELYPKGVSYLIGNNQIFYAPEVYGELLTRGLVRTLTTLLDPFIVTEHFITTNLAGGFLPAIGLALGLALSLRTIKGTRSILLLTSLGAGLFFLSVIGAFPPRHTHLVAIIPVLALLSAVGFAVSVDTLASRLFQNSKPALTDWIKKGILAIVAIVLVFFGLREYFVIMPERDPPLFEDIVSWIAWRNKEPLTIVYLDSTEKTPHRVEYLINTKMVPHKYLSIAPFEFDWQKLPVRSIVFIEPGEEGYPAPTSTFKNSATYLNKEGETIGYAWTNTEVDLQPSTPFSFTGKGFPVTIIAIVSTLAGVALMLLFLQIRVTTERMTSKSGLRIHVEITLRKTAKGEANEGT